MCTRLFYSVSGSLRNSLQVGYSDLCACGNFFSPKLLAIALVMSILEWV